MADPVHFGVQAPHAQPLQVWVPAPPLQSCVAPFAQPPLGSEQVAGHEQLLLHVFVPRLHAPHMVVSPGEQPPSFWQTEVKAPMQTVLPQLPQG